MLQLSAQLALLIACPIFLFQRRLLAAAATAVIFFGLDYEAYAYKYDMWKRDLDWEYLLSDGSVGIVNRGPIPFERARNSRRYDRQYSSINMQLDDGSDIGISVMSVSRPGSLFPVTKCITYPGPHGLVMLANDQPVPGCPTGGKNQENFSWPGWQEGVPIVNCLGKSDRPLCRQRFKYNGMRVHVSMWDVPLARWQEVRDRVIAVLDQSFIPVTDR